MTILEETNFKVNSDGREIKEFTGYVKGEETKIKCKVNKEWDIREYVSGVPNDIIGEQLFTYDALCRLGVEKRLPTFEQIKEIEDINFAGYWHPYDNKFCDIGDRSNVWLAGGDHADFDQNKWDRYDDYRHYGYSGRLLEAELTAVNGVDEFVEKLKDVRKRKWDRGEDVAEIERFYNELQETLKHTQVAKEDKVLPNKT